MEVSRVLLVLCVISVPCHDSTIYNDPCDLAKRLKFEYYPDYVTNISLAICIAGYRYYDTSHKLRHPNGKTFYGIFGLKHTGSFCRSDEFVDTYLGRDLRCLSSTVLSDPRNVYMYDRLCAPDLTYRYNCYQNRYFKIAEVWNPKYQDIFAMTFGEEHAIVVYLAAHGIDYYRPFGTPISTTTTRTTISTTTSTTTTASTTATTTTTTSTTTSGTKANSPKSNIISSSNSTRQLLVQESNIQAPTTCLGVLDVIFSTVIITLMLAAMGILIYRSFMNPAREHLATPEVPDIVSIPQSKGNISVQANTRAQ